METRYALLRLLAKASLNAFGGGVAGDFAVEVMPAIARDVWGWWSKERDVGQLRHEIEAVGQIPSARIRDEAEAVVLEQLSKAPQDTRDRTISFLTAIPGS